jgi:hypothetical protein
MKVELGCGLSVTSSHVITVSMNITHGHSHSYEKLLGSEREALDESRTNFPAIGVSVTDGYKDVHTSISETNVHYRNLVSSFSLATIECTRTGNAVRSDYILEATHACSTHQHLVVVLTTT